MTLEGKTKLVKHQKANTMYLSIPASIVNDSTFPFKDGDEVKIIVKGKGILIEK